MKNRVLPYLIEVMKHLDQRELLERVSSHAYVQHLQLHQKHCDAK
jgi:hypothetical protein